MDETGRKYYFNWQQRLELNHEGVDSHSHICYYYKIYEDKVNKFEYNPLTKVFEIDGINASIDNSLQAEKWVRELDFSTIVEPLIIKPIVNPLHGKAKKATKTQKELLYQWSSVWASVRSSVWDSVRSSVWASVGASVWAYRAGFVNIKYDYDFSPAITLWESGYVPSFDGTTWRLHSGHNAEIVFEWIPQKG